MIDQLNGARSLLGPTFTTRHQYVSYERLGKRMVGRARYLPEKDTEEFHSNNGSVLFAWHD